jgi:hypothetical protein
VTRLGEVAMVASLLDRITEFTAWLRSDKFPLPTIAALETSQCSPEGVVGREIERDRAYFSVEVKELFLTEGRKWWVTYSPAVLMIVEFIYGGQKISVPTLVGPNLIRQKNGQSPHGVVLENTLVAGPYPFRGGRVAITAILYRAQHHDHARSLLNFVEGVSAALGVPADMGTLLKIGGTVLEGLETLLRLGDAEPIAAHRIEFEGGSVEGFRSSLCTLIADGAVDPSLLRVQDGGRLKIDSGNGQTRRFDRADYVLYGINRRDRRGETSTLPFAVLQDQARSAALSGEDTGWTRAKANLLTLYQQMLLCPDVTTEEADEIMESSKAELLRLKKRREDLVALSTVEVTQLRSGTAERLAASTSIMNL